MKKKEGLIGYINGQSVNIVFKKKKYFFLLVHEV